MRLRLLSCALLLLVDCRKDAIVHEPPDVAPRAPVASVPASASVAESPPEPPREADLTDDDVAALVLAGYDPASRRVRTTAPPDAGPDIGEAIVVAASNGDVLRTYVDASLGRGGVHVERRHGEAWARGDVVAWVVVGTQPGLCGIEQGYLALLAGKRVVALAPWDGSCGPSYHASFASAQGRDVVLEEEGGSGEDGVSEQSNRVWVVSGARLKLAGSVRRSSEETWTHAIAGATRKMDSSVAGEPSGLLVTERWHFTFDATQKTKDVTRVLRYTLQGDSLIVPRNPDPTP